MSYIALAHLASPDVLAGARKIKLFLMDVDGTLTDGGVCLISTTAADGSGTSAVSEVKVFNAHDGQGLSLAHTMGIQTGFITGRHSPAVAKRAEELRVTFLYLGQAKKAESFEECMQKAGMSEEEVAYMGDDLPDIPPARRAGLAVCVADGAPELPLLDPPTWRYGRRPRGSGTYFEGSGTLGGGRAAGACLKDGPRNLVFQGSGFASASSDAEYQTDK